MGTIYTETHEAMAIKLYFMEAFFIAERAGELMGHDYEDLLDLRVQVEKEIKDLHPRIDPSDIHAAVLSAARMTYSR